MRSMGIAPLVAASLMLAACSGSGRGNEGAGAAPGGAGASAWTLGARFDARDRALAEQAEREALSRNSATTWNEPARGSSGQVTPLRTFIDAAGRECREFAHTVTIRDRQETANGTACRQPDGSWKVQGG